MRTFLLWSDSVEKPGAEVASALGRLLEPLVAVPPDVRTIETPEASLVVLEQQVKGMKAPFFEEDRDRWALAVDYPFGARRVDDEGSLPAICRTLEDDPASTLDEIAPPFCLVWRDRGGKIRIQNDALGQAQLFEYDDGRRWALTNRIFALRALGIPLIAGPEEWAVRATLGWFPLQLTGFRHLRFVGPGTQLRLSHTLHRTTHNVLQHWVRPDPLPEPECLELARSSLVDLIRATIPLCGQFSAGLSGGRDSRAVVASLRAVGADFSLRVSGSRDSIDVAIAKELARRAGLKLKVHERDKLAVADPQTLRRSISLALLWQAGYVHTGKHATFLARKNGFDGGVVNAMGQHGEIGRAD